MPSDGRTTCFPDWEADENYTKGAISIVRSNEKTALDKFLVRAKEDTADKVWSEMYDDKAFYFAARNKIHCRLIEIAVRKEWQGQGIGKLVLFRLLSRMKANGLYKLTFRTQSLKTRKIFGFNIGAKIVDVKGNDYEMELTIR